MLSKKNLNDQDPLSRPKTMLQTENGPQISFIGEKETHLAVTDQRLKSNFPIESLNNQQTHLRLPVTMGTESDSYETS